jgi:nitrate/nitrite transporter NarK
MVIIVLSVFGLIFLWTAVRRYRSDRLMLTAGLASAIGGIGGVALTIPQILLHTPKWLLLAIGLVAVVLAVGGSIYAERRHKELDIDRPRKAPRRVRKTG